MESGERILWSHADSVGLNPAGPQVDLSHEGEDILELTDLKAGVLALSSAVPPRLGPVVLMPPGVFHRGQHERDELQCARVDLPLLSRVDHSNSRVN